MKIVLVRFENQQKMRFLLESFDTKLCVIDFASLSVVCELSEEQQEEVKQKYGATITDLPNQTKK